jgi:hypothetical protein
MEPTRWNKTLSWVRTRLTEIKSREEGKKVATRDVGIERPVRTREMMKNAKVVVESDLENELR